jgi:flagellar basal-body rod protein FlgG
MFVGPYPYHLSHTYLGTLAQETRMNLISNNLANVGTPGFKKDMPVFEGYIVKGSKTHHAQGAFQQTGGNLDVALSGPGFFQVQTEKGLRYTRNGSFKINSLGEIVTQDGSPVVGAGVLPENVKEIAIAEDGRILADGQEVGRFDLVEFADPHVLAKEGNGYFAPKAPGVQGQASETTTVSQGYLEMSNVDPIMESVHLIDTLRTYEVFQKIVLSFQEADQKAINEVGRLL